MKTRFWRDVGERVHEMRPVGMIVLGSALLLGACAADGDDTTARVLAETATTEASSGATATSPLPVVPDLPADDSDPVLTVVPNSSVVASESDGDAPTDDTAIPAPRADQTTEPEQSGSADGESATELDEPAENDSLSAAERGAEARSSVLLTQPSTSIISESPTSSATRATTTTRDAQPVTTTATPATARSNASTTTRQTTTSRPTTTRQTTTTTQTAQATTSRPSTTAATTTERTAAPTTAATARATTSSTAAPTTTTAAPTTTTAETTTTSSTTTTSTTTPIPRVVSSAKGTPFARIGDVVLVHPASIVERIGYHESNHDGAQQMVPVEIDTQVMTLETRNRGNGSRTAADIVVNPAVEIVSPVTGTVKRSGSYTLYCDKKDHFVVIEPDARPGYEVKLLHIVGVNVSPGDRVEAGVTVLAPTARLLPFASQVDEFTSEPSWPHVHIEVVDPTIRDRPGSGC